MVKIIMYDEEENSKEFTLTLWQSMKLYFTGALGWFLVYIIIIISSGFLWTIISKFL